MTEGRNCSTILACATAVADPVRGRPRHGRRSCWRPAESSGGSRASLFRSRDPGRALVIGLVLLLVHAIVFREAFARDTDRVGGFVRRVLPGLALCCALVLGAHAIHYGSFTAGGSDSCGYVSQAYGWAQGHVAARRSRCRYRCRGRRATRRSRRWAIVPGPQPHTMVPSYAPGLPLMMAAALVFGACGPFLVVPLCAALVVWLTFLLGRRTGGPWAGMLAALFVVTSPIVLFQSLWPMSDVPAAALWTGAALAALGDSRRSALAAGCGRRPACWCVRTCRSFRSSCSRTWPFSSRGRERWIRVALFSAAGRAGGDRDRRAEHGLVRRAVELGIRRGRRDLLRWQHPPNLARYPVWLWQSQSPLVLLALVPLLPRFRGDASQPAVRLCAALFLATLLQLPRVLPLRRVVVPAVPAAGDSGAAGAHGDRAGGARPPAAAALGPRGGRRRHDRCWSPTRPVQHRRTACSVR